MPRSSETAVAARRCALPLRLVAVLAVMASLWTSTGVAASAANPPNAETLEQAIRRGVEFLLRSQNPDGSWGSAHRTKDLNIFAPVPGAHHAFRSGTTALCVQALAESGLAATDTATATALEKGEAWLLENLPKLRRADSVAIYNVWGHAYGIQALAVLARQTNASPAQLERIREVIRGQFDLLRRYESIDGGWGYYDLKVGAQRPTTDSTSFVSATVLVAFFAAKRVGVAPPEDLVKRAVASINRQRKNDNSYLYGEYLRWRPMRGINRAAGSLGRSQACNLALRLWGDETVTEKVFDEWLERLVKRNGWLSMGRKRPVPHESWFQVAAYFFYYGHYYAALCAEHASPAKAAALRSDLAAVLLPLQEKDGSWWDFPFYDYHQPYGTAFALMSLRHLQSPEPAVR